MHLINRGKSRAEIKVERFLDARKKTVTGVLTAESRRKGFRYFLVLVRQLSVPFAA
jgi:hypothetical protein